MRYVVMLTFFRLNLFTYKFSEKISRMNVPHNVIGRYTY